MRQGKLNTQVQTSSLLKTEEQTFVDFEPGIGGRLFHNVTHPSTTLKLKETRRRWTSQRIGAEIARILHENSMNVIIHYHHSQEDAEKLCEIFNQKRAHSAAIVKADIATAKSWVYRMDPLPG